MVDIFIEITHLGRQHIDRELKT